MAQAIQIDTLEFSKSLQAAGADERLAEAIVKGITGADTSELTTKDDLKNTEALLRSEISEVEASLKSEISEVEASLKSEISHVRTEISEVEASLKSEISDVRTELKSEIVGVKSDLKWMKGIGAAILAAVVIPMLTELL